MTESPTTYKTTENEFAVAQSFTLYMVQIGELSDLQQRTGQNRSELVRQAIDLLYAHMNQAEE